jgi:serine/threonine protein phosphatase PrpC
MNKKQDFNWVGNQESFVDQPSTIELGNIAIGRYGGNSSAGQYKNEDGCFLMLDPVQDWEFVILLDAHNSAESAELIVEAFSQKKEKVRESLSLSANEAFRNLERLALNLFQSEEFLEACQKVEGETACLIVARKGKYCWWFSVGDCLFYLHHPELASLGQYQVNQRHFYEWIGQVNTFNQAVPCFSSGTKELRKGVNHLIMTTDGLVECPGEPYIEPRAIFNEFSHSSNKAGVRNLLKRIKDNNVRDSTTIVSWMVVNNEESTIPSE